jgi:pimeloyl-ACP methyl ester carboxylesterase
MLTSSTPVVAAGTAANVQTGSIEVGDDEVRYHDSVGEGAGRSPVVLVHGTGGSTRQHFSFIFPMLATAQRVVSIDLATPAGDPADGPARMAEQVAAVIEEVLPGRQVALTGYSLGAVVAATTAAHRPELVDKLVLLAGWLRTDAQQRLRNDVWRALRRPEDHDTLRRFSVFCSYSPLFLSLCGPDDVAGLLAGVTFDDSTAQQMEMNRTVDLTELAPRISCPTLVVAGTDDQMTPRRQAKRLFGAIEDARYTEITSGHAMVIERPAELVHLVTTFNQAPGRHPAGSILPAQRP